MKDRPRSLDEEIARHLEKAAESGELAGAKGYGKPLPEVGGWDDTPEALRMPFKTNPSARACGKPSRSWSRRSPCGSRLCA